VMILGGATAAVAAAATGTPPGKWTTHSFDDAAPGNRPPASPSTGPRTWDDPASGWPNQ
jgi:hypothetical protein